MFRWSADLELYFLCQPSTKEKTVDSINSLNYKINEDTFRETHSKLDKKCIKCNKSYVLEKNIVSVTNAHKTEGYILISYKMLEV